MFEAKLKLLQLTEKDSLYPAQRNKSKFSDKNENENENENENKGVFLVIYTRIG